MFSKSPAVSVISSSTCPWGTSGYRLKMASTEARAEGFNRVVLEKLVEMGTGRNPFCLH